MKTVKLSLLVLLVLCVQALRAQDPNPVYVPADTLPHKMDGIQDDWFKLLAAIQKNGAGYAGMAATSATPVIGSVSTPGTGATFVTLPTQAARRVRVFNLSGTTLEVRYNGAGLTLPIPTATTVTLFVMANAAELSFRRVDQNATPAVVNYIAEQ